MLNFIRLLIHTSYDAVAMSPSAVRSGYRTEMLSMCQCWGTVYMESHVDGGSSSRPAFTAEHAATKSSGRAYRSTPKAHTNTHSTVSITILFPNSFTFALTTVTVGFNRNGENTLMYVER